MPAEAPDPFFNITTREHYRVVGWNQHAVSVAAGDLDGDRQPDIAVVTKPLQGTPAIQIYLNDGGYFPATASRVIPLPDLTPRRILIEDLNDDGVGDLIVTGDAIVPQTLDAPPGRRSTRGETQMGQFLSQCGKFRPEPITFQSPAEVIRVRREDLDGDGKRDVLLCSAHGGIHQVNTKADRTVVDRLPQFKSEPYPDLYFRDYNGDKLIDVLTSTGELFLRGAGGELPAKPGLVLQARGTEWTYAATGDFNGDGRFDFVMMTNDSPAGTALVDVFLNTLDSTTPFSAKPTSKFDIVLGSWQNPRSRFGLLRSSLVAADWNGDGIDDVVFGAGQSDQATILLGAKSGLDHTAQETIPLEFMLHYEHGMVVEDFNADGKPDLACFGNTLGAGVGGSKGGPTAMFVRLSVQ
ncbi:MAG: hypothetical protein ACI9UA_005084 [Pseudoalteromonas tetraodonis]|jgi:hypothetical protein